MLLKFRSINNRLQWVLKTNRTINQEQAGFRTHRSTSEHVVKLSQSIKDTLDKKTNPNCGVC